MHPNPAFRQTPAHRVLAFAAARGFGTLIVNGPGGGTTGPLVAHVPFLIGAGGAMADLHLARSNPIARSLAAPLPALIAVTGPDGYISPDWYGMEGQVPTWNYVAAHLRGTLSLRPEAELLDHLDDLSARFESQLLPKAPWLTGKLSADDLRRFLRMIVPCRLTIDDVQGTWKLGQNKPDHARSAAASALDRSGIGQETTALANLMRHAGDPE